MSNINFQVKIAHKTVLDRFQKNDDMLIVVTASGNLYLKNLISVLIAYFQT